MVRKYRDEAWLRERYEDGRKTVQEIADECGVSHPTILDWMDRFGIERRDPWHANRTNVAGFNTRPDGKEYWNDGSDTVYVHRLLAVAEYGFDAVCDRHIHHRNNIPWDNRPANIEPLTASEHASLTREDGHPMPAVRYANRRYYDRDWLYEQYVEEGRSTYDIANGKPFTAESVRRWLDDFGIERRERWG